MTRVSRAWLRQHAPKAAQALPAPHSKTSTDKADDFAAVLATHAPDVLDVLEREYRFASPRLFRADFAHVASKVLIEVDGGRWAAGGGRHMNDEDHWKQIEAAKRGWRVVRVSPTMIEREPLQVIEAIRGCITHQKGG